MQIKELDLLVSAKLPQANVSMKLALSYLVFDNCKQVSVTVAVNHWFALTGHTVFDTYQERRVFMRFKASDPGSLQNNYDKFGSAWIGMQSAGSST